MNFSLTTMNAASQQSATPAPPAAVSAPTAAPSSATLDGVQAVAVPTTGVPAELAFAQWLGLAPVVAAPAPVDAAPVDGAPTENAEPALETGEPAPLDAPLLTALDMPIMPVMPNPQMAMAAMSPALATGAPAPTGTDYAAPDFKLPTQTADAPIELRANPRANPRTTASMSDLMAAMPAAKAPLDAAVSPATQNAPMVPAAATAAAPTVLPADAAVATTPKPAAATTLPEPTIDQPAAPPERSAASAVGMAPAIASATLPASDSVTLSGPPTAWRQTLQEALGERLHLQVGKNAEQAVIRLDPPMLGRIEIAIRHSAGTLEVNISATHGEVVRQLQNVTEGLRHDLGQRQFSEVAVNVSQARAPSPGLGGGDNAGRGRGQDQPQHEHQQPDTPGRALAEAHNASSSFSLT